MAALPGGVVGKDLGGALQIEELRVGDVDHRTCGAEVILRAVLRRLTGACLRFAAGRPTAGVHRVLALETLERMAPQSEVALRRTVRPNQRERERDAGDHRCASRFHRTPPFRARYGADPRLT